MVRVGRKPELNDQSSLLEETQALRTLRRVGALLRRSRSTGVWLEVRMDLAAGVPVQAVPVAEVLAPVGALSALSAPSVAEPTSAAVLPAGARSPASSEQRRASLASLTHRRPVLRRLAPGGVALVLVAGGAVQLTGMTAAAADETVVSIPNQSMEGNVTIKPGDWIDAGYAFTGGTSGVGIHFDDTSVTIPVSCTLGGTPVGGITVPLADATWTAGSGQVPWANVNPTASPVTATPYTNGTDPFQGALQAPDLCSGGFMYNGSAQSGATLRADVTSLATSTAISIQFHWRVPESKGALATTNCANVTDPDVNPWNANICGAPLSAAVSVTPALATTQTLAGDIYLCGANNQTTTTEVVGGTLAATGPQAVPSGPNPLAPTSVPAGSYQVTATAPTGYTLTGCGPALANPATVLVPGGGAGQAIFYVTQTSSATNASPTVSITKTNNAAGTGYGSSETVAAGATNVPYRAVVTNTSSAAGQITVLTDTVNGQTMGICPDLIGATLAPGVSATCDFSGPIPTVATTDTAAVTLSVSSKPATASASSTVFPPVAVPPTKVTSTTPTTVKPTPAPTAVAPTTVAPTMVAPTAVGAATASNGGLASTGAPVKALVLWMAFLLATGIAILAGLEITDPRRRLVPAPVTGEPRSSGRAGAGPVEPRWQRRRGAGRGDWASTPTAWRSGRRWQTGWWPEATLGFGLADPRSGSPPTGPPRPGVPASLPPSAYAPAARARRRVSAGP